MIKIARGEVYVYAPQRYNNDKGERLIADFVAQKIDWIQRKQYEYNTHLKKMPGIIELKAFYWRGTQIFAASTDKRKRVKFDGHTLTVPSALNNNADALRKQLITSFKAQATEELCKRLRELSERYGLLFADCGIMDAKTKWGVCTSAKKITLNWRLALLDDEIRDYVILHELCHLAHMNHSAAFWNALTKMLPECKMLRKRLLTYDFLMAYLRKE